MAYPKTFKYLYMFPGKANEGLAIYHSMETEDTIRDRVKHLTEIDRNGVELLVTTGGAGSMIFLSNGCIAMQRYP